ncbi:hypothetical protein PISMIDRAFT_269749 [Pisolithus microcarpus 441]|uniref:Unplaced genomic scaffold scaffold_178, whole genome shotgun sequence n=1 Tax=Pisolithus microcarpus 441 TaxID=765257 RepID=A0A0C9YR19_9AGAM|nr:hypothetical protein BKA83DRAFT_269749 [Pisolithus microcarpus]KIK13359.1 hypothetical protein PISMIDRAFT_405311 [Pisolithus microcarpus 441]KIK16294.1 hypothetical protein PISMIDRAFT_269749 [Pisolithus microcarpus 441]
MGLPRVGFSHGYLLHLSRRVYLLPTCQVVYFHCTYWFMSPRRELHIDFATTPFEV